MLCQHPSKSYFRVYHSSSSHLREYALLVTQIVNQTMTNMISPDAIHIPGPTSKMIPSYFTALWIIYRQYIIPGMQISGFHNFAISNTSRT